MPYHRTIHAKGDLKVQLEAAPVLLWSPRIRIGPSLCLFLFGPRIGAKFLPSIASYAFLMEDSSGLYVLKSSMKNSKISL